MDFLSQQGEDIYILLNFINRRNSSGIYLELGACDGHLYSNTFFFEKYLHFKGILIEPQPNLFTYLQKNRSRNICINKAICNTPGKVEFLTTTNNHHLPCGGILDEMSTEHIKSWFKDTKNSYLVETDKLSSIFSKYNITYIDLFSLDVEGAELSVLETIHFNNIEIYVICIEISGEGQKEQKCRDLLTKNGFTFKKSLGINEFWVNENYSRKHLVYDPNHKINFTGINNDRTSNLGKHYFVEQSLLEEINNACKKL